MPNHPQMEAIERAGRVKTLMATLFVIALCGLAALVLIAPLVEG